MTFLRAAFDRLTEHEFRWASTVFRIASYWIGGLFCLIAVFYLIYRMKVVVATIPGIIQAACLFLVAMAILLIMGMFCDRGRALEAFDRFLAVFADLKPFTERERVHGLSSEKISAIRRKAGTAPGRPREWWRAIDESLEYYVSPSGDEGWFITRAIGESLPEEDVVDPFYRWNFYQAVPGILTSLGLLATFVAILMALAGVTYDARDPIRPVSGIDQLINGLSGKFLSSIIALILSVVFTFLEKRVCEGQLREGYDQMIRRCRNVFPLLSQSRILLDLQRIATISGERSASTHLANAPERG
jgi:hypothetical protein